MKTVRAVPDSLILVLLISMACSSETPPLNSSGLNPDSMAALDTFLAEKVAEGVIPGGTMVVGRATGSIHETAFGRYAEHDTRPVALNTIYDLASLTKVVGLTTAVYMLVADGRLAWDERVQTYVPEFQGPQKNAVTVRHLLTHTSGLPAWIPLHLETANREDALDRVIHEPLTSEPGAEYVYSDLGAILMAQIVERVTRQTLDIFLQEALFEPLRMRDTGFNPSPDVLSRIAPTENDAWRGRMVHGEVHDENAFHLGGVSGHAGLFSSARDLATFAGWMLLNFSDQNDEGLPSISGDSLRKWTARQPGPEGSNRALGWQKPVPGGGNSGGSLLSEQSFGHTGFTGTSIWMDPTNDLYLVSC